ncbi:hypothetical protein ADK53_36945 [Streptomyces sp. WM6373]|uniref:hypothetical protein n=1 Tax=Streptomyces TaxID=1883 RepID=UPI0006B02D4A|nr:MULTISPECIES: hypothetical protein [unclassified Streptomyces]KOU27634.1 hypothetical protein ADK53_36945 [Streptomyces sp. WM6373]KOV48087.1 hypothetical protein ADK97_02360 [Streptomyces sp. H021]
MPDHGPDGGSDHRPDSAPDGGHRRSLWLWALLGLFAACVPCALLVVEKLGSALPPVPLVLAVLAALAGYVLAVQAVVGEWFGQRPRRVRFLVWSAAAVLFLGSLALLLVFRPPPPPLTRMSGARDLAVAGFAAESGRQDRQVLDDVAAAFAHDMAARIPAATAVRSYAGEASLPLAQLADTRRDALERKTARFADETNAEMVIAGLVSEDQAGQTTLRPAVYVRADQIPDSPELTGWFLGEPVLIARGWESARARAQLTGELTRRIDALTQFVDALDTWRNGSPAHAGRILTTLLDAEQRNHAGGFVPPDLVRLFHGHVLEDQAYGESGPGRERLLEEARSEYLAIRRDSPAGRRAALSLQGNAYRRAIGPTHSCTPGTVRATDLAQVSKALRLLAVDPGMTELGRMKANANLAQVEQCRITARLVKDDGTVERAVRAVRTTPDLTGAADLRAFAESVAAVNAAGRGDLAAAVDRIRAAIAHGQDPVQRAVWHGLLASWSLERCDLTTARKAQQDALTQLAAAERAGRADSALVRRNEEAFATELRQAEERCAQADKTDEER